MIAGQQREEKELEPWDPSTGVNGDETSLELEPGANGWDANDMFRKNEQIYGVQSTFDNSLAGYTVQLNPTDSADYKYVSLISGSVSLNLSFAIVFPLLRASFSILFFPLTTGKQRQKLTK